ncbi:unnamed protein product, partial [Vitis vinifera]
MPSISIIDFETGTDHLSLISQTREIHSLPPSSLHCLAIKSSSKTMSLSGFSGGSGGGGPGGGSAAPQSYFCYQCNLTVSITPSPTSDPLCPHCNDGFLEEVENPNPNPIPVPIPNPFLGFSDLPSLSAAGATATAFPPLVFSTAAGGSIDLQNSVDFPGLFGADPDAFHPFAFLQNYLQTLRAGGTNVQFVIDGNSPEGTFRLSPNLGDYFIGPGLEQLIQQLAENDPNRVRCARTALSSMRRPSRCLVSTFTITIVFYLGWNCIIRVRSVGTSCPPMIPTTSTALGVAKSIKLAEMLLRPLGLQIGFWIRKQARRSDLRNMGKRKGFKSVTIVEHRNNLLIHRRLVTDVFFILCLGIIIMGKCLLFSFSDFLIISPFQDELFSCIPYNLVWEPFYIFLSGVSHFCAVSCDGLALF